MTKIRMALRLVALTFTLGALATSSTAAQQAQEVDVARALALETEATQLLDNQSEFNRAARLLRQAATFRPEGDAIALQDLYRASHLEYYRGKERRAVNQLATLADRALQEGDVLTAAQALADAAWICNEEGMGERAFNYSVRAQRLALSPLISEEQRKALKTRFKDTEG